MENSMEGVFHNQPAQAPNDTVQFTLPETQYIGPYDWTYGAGNVSFTGVPTSGYMEITTSSTN